MNELSDAQLTEFLLKATASRLSGREDCKGVTYKVEISDEVPQHIKFTPSTYVYPDQHRRKDSDRTPIIQHMLEFYLDELIDISNSPDGSIVIVPKSLVPGTYEYVPSIDKKKRKWFKTSTTGGNK